MDLTGGAVLCCAGSWKVRGYRAAVAHGSIPVDKLNRTINGELAVKLISALIEDC